jgi:hypothetical protein
MLNCVTVVSTLIENNKLILITFIDLLRDVEIYTQLKRPQQAEYLEAKNRKETEL